MFPCCIPGFALGGKGYIITGLSSTWIFQRRVWEYDNVSDSWKELDTFPGSARVYAGGFAVGTSGYVISGYNGDWSTYIENWGFTPTTTGIPENKNQLISVIPNPVKDVLSLSLNNDYTGNIEIDVYDLSGRSVFNQTITKRNQYQLYSINLENLNKGVHFLKLLNNHGNNLFEQLILIDN